MFISLQVGTVDIVVKIEPTVLRREAFPRQLLAVSPFADLEVEETQSPSTDSPGENTPRGHSQLRRSSKLDAETLTQLHKDLAARHQRRSEAMGEMSQTMKVFSFPSGHSLRIMKTDPKVRWCQIRWQFAGNDETL